MMRMLPAAGVVPILLIWCAVSPWSSRLSSASITGRWRELQGQNMWSGLLDPLDMDLRRSVIAYGELVEAAYDSFNMDLRSPHAGACRYGRADLLTSTMVPGAANYAVTRFVYATSGPGAFTVLPAPEVAGAWSRESNWIGYVAVATDRGVQALGRRDIVVVWRGTIKPLEWANDFDATPVPAAPVLGARAAANPLAMVHRGFLSAYMASNPSSKYTKASARDQVLAEVRRLMELHKDEETSITVTGHSLGAALATLNAVDIAAHGLNAAGGRSPSLVTAMVYACPHVGDSLFKAAVWSLQQAGLRNLHVKNAGDGVTMVPPLPFVDVAVVLFISTSRSPYLRVPATAWMLHDLECYLHAVAGEQGRAGGFRLVVDRDVALVNKHNDALKVGFFYQVPPFWWAPRNKGMVRDAAGKWRLQDFEEI